MPARARTHVRSFNSPFVFGGMVYGAAKMLFNFHSLYARASPEFMFFVFFFFSSLSSVIVDNVVVIVIIIMFFFFSFCHSSTRFRRYLSQCFPFFQCTILESFVFVCVCHFRVSIHFLNITTSCKVITDAFRLSSKGRTSFEVQFICRNECSLY